MNLHLHDPVVKRFVLPWACMLGLLVLELLAMALHLGPAAPFLALVMAGIVVLGPMQLGQAPNAARIFALAGAFWLVVVLFGLGTLDPLTRHHLPSLFHSEPQPLIPARLHGPSIAALVLGVLCAALILIDVIRHPQNMFS